MMDRKGMLNLSCFILLLTVCLLTLSCERNIRDIESFPKMLAKDIETSVFQERRSFYIFERDGSRECTVAYALGEIEPAIDVATRSGMQFKVIIPLSTLNEHDTRVLSKIRETSSLAIRMTPKEILNGIPENSYFAKTIYFSGSFVCQEIEHNNSKNRKYVKRWPYAPTLAIKLRDSFEELWKKSVPL